MSFGIIETGGKVKQDFELLITMQEPPTPPENLPPGMSLPPPLEESYTISTSNPVIITGGHLPTIDIKGSAQLYGFGRLMGIKINGLNSTSAFNITYESGKFLFEKKNDVVFNFMQDVLIELIIWR